jgi:signal transduction histidine kinase
MVITPLVYRSRVVGVLKVMSGRPRAFARDAMDLLRLLAGFLAVAMVHAEAQDAREELRRREHERLAELERLRDELASLVVHDLRSPLSVVSSNLQYLREALPEGSRDALEAALEALAATKRLDALILLLLDVAKLEQRQLPVRKESVHPAVLVEELRALRAHQVRTRDVQIANAIDPGRCVNADAGLLRRMFDNIVDNALRHTPRGGRIEFVANGQGNLVELRIGNSGPPIPPEVRPRMFEKFIQGDHAARFNHGLGLYFCKLAVEAQGGRIWIESHADLPTVFAMSLPTP